MKCELDTEPGRADALTDPFLAALDAAEYDDEPYTDEQQAAAREGWAAFQRGETISLDELRRELFGKDWREPS